MKKKKYVNSGTVSTAPAAANQAWHSTPTSLLINDSFFNYHATLSSLEENANLYFVVKGKETDSLINLHITHQLIIAFGLKK